MLHEWNTERRKFFQQIVTMFLSSRPFASHNNFQPLYSLGSTEGHSSADASLEKSFAVQNALEKSCPVVLIVTVPFVEITESITRVKCSTNI